MKCTTCPYDRECNSDCPYWDHPRNVKVGQTLKIIDFGTCKLCKEETTNLRKIRLSLMESSKGYALVCISCCKENGLKI